MNLPTEKEQRIEFIKNMGFKSVEECNNGVKVFGGHVSFVVDKTFVNAEDILEVYGRAIHERAFRLGQEYSQFEMRKALGVKEVEGQ